MAWRVLWKLKCDHCHAEATFSGAPSTAVEKKAIRYGWRFVIDDYGLIRHLCKACASKPEVAAVYERSKRL